MPAETLLPPPFYVESFTGSPERDLMALEDIRSLHVEEYHPIYHANLPEGYDNLIKQYLKKDIIALEKAYTDPEVDHVLLIENSANIIVGFTSAGKAGTVYDRDVVRAERGAMGLSVADQADLNARTVTVGHTMIHAHYRRQGGWAMMMDELDEKITERGSYTSMTRFATTEGGYADKVKARYRKRLRFEKPLKTILDGQLYMRFDLPT
jgi:hypothetical protein